MFLMVVNAKDFKTKRMLSFKYAAYLTKSQAKCEIKVKKMQELVQSMFFIYKQQNSFKNFKTKVRTAYCVVYFIIDIIQSLNCYIYKS